MKGHRRECEVSYSFIPPKTSIEFEVVHGLPEVSGRYLFLLKDRSVREGYIHLPTKIQIPRVTFIQLLGGYRIEGDDVTGWLKEKRHYGNNGKFI